MLGLISGASVGNLGQNILTAERCQTLGPGEKGLNFPEFPAAAAGSSPDWGLLPRPTQPGTRRPLPPIFTDISCPASLSRLTASQQPNFTFALSFPQRLAGTGKQNQSQGHREPAESHHVEPNPPEPSAADKSTPPGCSPSAFSAASTPVRLEAFLFALPFTRDVTPRRRLIGR